MELKYIIIDIEQLKHILNNINIFNIDELREILFEIRFIKNELNKLEHKITNILEQNLEHKIESKIESKIENKLEEEIDIDYIIIRKNKNELNIKIDLSKL